MRETKGERNEEVENDAARCLLAALVLGFAVFAAACGGDEEAAEPAAEAPAEPAEPPAEPAPAEEPADTGAAEPAEEPAGEAPSGEPILIGISTAQTGILAPYDLQAGQLFEMRIAQINEERRRARQADRDAVDRHEVG